MSLSIYAVIPLGFCAQVQYTSSYSIQRDLNIRIELKKIPPAFTD